MSPQIDETRLAKIVALYPGKHAKNGNGHVEACLMEAIAFVAGETWSDHPKCVCPVLGAFARAWNDALPDNDVRTKLLKPLIPRLIGTRSTKEIEARRATMASDWYVRVHTPAWLRLAGLTAHADALASLPEITSFENTPSILVPLEAAQKDASAAWSAARSAAWSAAESAAESAAWSAAWSAARSAAESAAESAARSAAWSAARSAAWSAARSAARSAAWSAARSAAESAAWSAALKVLQPTSDELQTSALDLLNRMIALTDPAEKAA